MAKKRDMLDDIIDIQSDWQAVSNPLGSLTNALAGEPGDVKTWNPADYKERPRANVTSCIRCKTKDEAACSACIDVCPVDAIEIEEGSIELSDTCRKCGLCVAVCPTEAFVTREQSPKKLYDKIVAAAVSHEECYVTCTRALGRIPKDNEVVLPCVGLVPAETWFSVIVDYPNVSVYLPLDICERCKTVTGEEVYVDAIGQAEEWSEEHLGLEVDEADLDHDKRRSWERKQFVNTMVKGGTALIGGANPVVNAAQMITTRLSQHAKQITQLENTLAKVTGTDTPGLQRRILTQKRQLVLSTLQKHPGLVEHFEVTQPSCNSDLCTMCGDCVSACPQHATALDKRGRFSVQPAYCVGCGACVVACDQGALTMIEGDPEDLLVPDEDAERKKAAEEKQKAEVERLKKVGKKRFAEGLDSLGKLADSAASAASAPKKPATTAKKPATTAKKPASSSKKH